MSRLHGMTAREVFRKLSAAGSVFDRVARSAHEIWIHPETRRRTVVPNHHGNLKTGTLRQIIRDAGFTVEEFMDLDK